jgi:hypothetical protein
LASGSINFRAKQSNGVIEIK